MLKSSGGVLDARTERFAGTIARITSPVRQGGVGEIVYEMNGVRQVSAARTADGRSLPRGSQVLVLRREKGMAIVEPWTKDDDLNDWEQRFATPAAVESTVGSTGKNGLNDANRGGS
jgi:hypothetical protein